MYLYEIISGIVPGGQVILTLGLEKKTLFISYIFSYIFEEHSNVGSKFSEKCWDNGRSKPRPTDFPFSIIYPWEAFYTLAEARVLIEQWRKEYNQIQPHSALGYRPPAPEAVMPVIILTGLI